MQGYTNNMRVGIAINAHTAEEHRQERRESFWERLAAEIVIAAVKDWRSLVSGKMWRSKERAACNFTELRLFFESDWCAFLMQDMGITPKRILALLEQELADAKRKDEIESWR